MSEIRYNFLYDRYVIISPERLHRPPIGRLDTPDISQHSPRSTCPFCEGNESKTTPEITSIREAETKPNQKGWKTRVIPNLYRALSIETPHLAQTHGIFKYHQGFGAHEVIIDTTDHDSTLDKWPHETFVNWLTIMRERVTNLRKDFRLKSIVLFKNHGIKAGATQTHPHTQLIALPVIPTQQLELYRRYLHYYQTNKRVMIEDMIVQEYSDNMRIILESHSFVAFCPFASEYPFELLICAKEGLSRFEYISEQQIDSLSELLSMLFKRLEKVLGKFDYNISIEIPPLNKDHSCEEFYDAIDSITRFTMRITPRVYMLAGFETTANMMINPVSPERAASKLRESHSAR